MQTPSKTINSWLQIELAELKQAAQTVAFGD